MEPAVGSIKNELSGNGYRMTFASCYDGWLHYEVRTEEYTVHADVDANTPKETFTAIASPEQILDHAYNIEVHDHNTGEWTTYRNVGD